MNSIDKKTIFSSADEIFGYVVTSLALQGERSIDGHLCKYRGLNGLKCAVGQLIPDELYSPEFEGKFWCRLTDLVKTDYPELNYFFNRSKLMDHSYLIEKLQGVHDSKDAWKSKHDFIFRFKDLAYEFGINFDFDNLKFGGKLAEGD